MFLDEYHKLIKEGKEEKQQKTDTTENPFIQELKDWIISNNIGKSLKCDNTTLIHEIEDKLGSILELGNGFWAKGLGRLYCAIRKGTTPDNRDAVVADFVNYMSDVISLLIEEGGEDSKGSLYVPKGKKNKTPDARDFNGKSFEEIKNVYDDRVQAYIKQNENPIVIKPSGHTYDIRKINSVEELDGYEKYFQDNGAEPWNLFGNQTIWNKYTRGGKNTFYVCVRDDVDNVQGEFYDMPSNYPYDDYGLSLFYVILTPAGSITNCTSRYNFVHDLDLTGEYSDSGFKNFFCKNAKRIQEAIGLQNLNEFYKTFKHGIEKNAVAKYFDVKHPLYQKGNIYIYTNKEKNEFLLRNSGIADTIYDEFSGFENGPALVKREGKYRYLSQNGKELSYNLKGQEVVGAYDYAEPFRNNRAIVSKNTRYGIINTTGDWIIGLDKNFDCIKRLKENLFSIKVKDKWGVCDLEGHIKISPQFNFIGEEDEYGCTIITDKSNKMGIVEFKDDTAKVLIPCKYKDIFLNEVSINEKNQRISFTMLIGENNKVGFCEDFRKEDFDYKKRTECLYTKVQLNVQMSQINSNQHQYINYNNAIIAQKNHRYVLISTYTFKEIKDCEYDLIKYIYSINVEKEALCGIVKNNNKYGFIDINGKKVSDCIYDSVTTPMVLNASGDSSYKCENDTNKDLDFLFTENTTYSIVKRDGVYFLLLLNVDSVTAPVEVGIKEVQSDVENKKDWIPCLSYKNDVKYGWDLLKPFNKGTAMAKKKELMNGDWVNVARNGSIVTKSVSPFDESIDYFKIKKMNKVPLFESYLQK